ncbi:MAG TPA: KEOPS complex kinase/ATPase Bud32 [Candidatus Nanoarchaeia archaeon]|nr:KEOPS complex kinase/ATPase Bud32 [Candidatus Nanoarchaeia archaeon]
MKLIAHAAEAKIYKEKNTIIKERIKKTYRFPLLDEKIRKQRTRKEVKILKKIETLIPVPKLIDTNNIDTLSISYIPGKILAQCLDSQKNKRALAKQIGTSLTKLHDAHIIHGDLTTSNLILNKKTIYFIDFGLSFESSRPEDKAVDLHLLKEALVAKHFKHAKMLFKTILQGYKQSENAKEVLLRLKKVESRGRYKPQI